MNWDLCDHVALHGDGLINGERTVLSFSAQTRGLAEPSMSAFAGGRPATVDETLALRHPRESCGARGSNEGNGYSCTEFN